MDFTRAIVSTLSGVLFGIAIEKGRVHVPELIIGTVPLRLTVEVYSFVDFVFLSTAQMKMEHFVMMKMFLSAVASGSAALALLSTVSPQRFNVAKETYRSCLWRSVGSVGVGGALLGVGMTVAGACPGTVLVQFGAGLPSTVLVLVGGYAGALAFAVVEPWLRDHVFAPPPNVKGRFVDEHITTMSGSTMAVALSVAMAGCVFMLEQFVPWQADIGMPLDMSAGFPSLSARAWPPYVAGAIIGLLQIPVVLFLGDTIGSASSYATTVSNVCYACVPSAVSHNKHLMGAKDGWANWWQVLYAAGAVLGGHLSASASQQAGAMVAEATGVTPVRSVLGGFIILFGSRLAGGCTSGHGISGMGLMSTLSFVAVAAMFAGGMGTALLL